MLRRPIRPLLLAVLALAAGCQNYNFNPVGQCVIQPGSSRLTLSGVTTADILFVVDDSGSMQPEQARLAANFKSFIGKLAAVQADRTSKGLQPFDFHIAITTSSVFEAWKPNQSVTCAASGSGYDCHFQTRPAYNYVTSNDVACAKDEAGLACSDLMRNYYFPTNPAQAAAYCGQTGVGTAGGPFPAGDFVAAAGNPRVLHFTGDLNWSTWANGTTSDATLAKLVQQFQQNIAVGTCGSGMEQHIEGGRLAIEKALKLNGLAQPSDVAADEWPHAGSKLVLVFVGDEDDCSNPNDPTQSLAFEQGLTLPGSDVCIAEQKKALDQQKLFKIQDYATFFKGLGHSLGAAFVYSADPASCKADASGNTICTPGTCTCQCPPSCNGHCGTGSAFQGECVLDLQTCGGWIPNLSSDPVNHPELGSRFAQMSAAFRSGGANTYEGSVCAADWSQTLSGIADLVKLPPGLTLPTTPATSDVTVLRIDDAAGKTVKYCTGPSTTADWNFIDCTSGAATANGGKSPTACLVINHGTGSCEASAGQTYIAQYLGRVPADGCTEAAASATTNASATSASCATALGGAAKDWQCVGAQYSGNTLLTAGTCICASGQ